MAMRRIFTAAHRRDRVPRVRTDQRILVVGSGGREHALAWRLGRDPGVDRVLVAPGNDGIAVSFPCFPVAESDAAALIDLCARERVSLVVIGPEGPLAAGLADALAAAGIAVFGPSAAAAELEASKWTAKQVMNEAGIPNARARRFDSLPEAVAALAEFGPPWVIKADGLAAGKGVCVTEERSEAERFLRECLAEQRFGAAGRRVVIESFLRGEEASVMAVCDGERFTILPPARDYKRAEEGDRGPNTGGMGACAPTTAVTPPMEEEIARRIVGPVLEAMRRRGTPYRGALYAGLMITPSGPFVIEFNCRFGDPEAQAVLPLVEGSFARLLAGAAHGSLDRAAVSRSVDSVVSVAVVAEPYPAPGGGGTIEHLDELMAREDLMVFHAGTARREGRWTVQGGRVVHVAARAASGEEARERVYRALATLGGTGWRYRADIAAIPPGAGGTTRAMQAAGGTGGMPWTCGRSIRRIPIPKFSWPPPRRCCAAASSLFPPTRSTASAARCSTSPRSRWWRGSSAATPRSP